MELLEKAEIRVICTKREDGRMNIDIAFPKEQLPITHKSSAMMLASGINLLVRSCSQIDSELKDYELLEEVIDYMKSEFVSTDSYNDLMYKKENFLKDK